MSSTPTTSRTPQLTLSEAMTLAHQHWNAGQAQKAEQLCQRILAQWPQQADALHLLGLMAHAVGRLELAVTYMRQACLTLSAPAIYFSNLAEMCRQQGLLVEAEQAGQQAVARDPALVDAWSNLGIILQESGKLDDSLECLKRVVTLRPDAAQAHNNLANTYRHLDRPDRAEWHYKQALILDPNYAEAYSNLSSLLSSQGHFDEAVVAGRRAIELNPRLVDAYLNIAEAETQRLNHGEALHWLDALHTFAPQHVGGLTARALVLKNDEAQRCARQALALGPNDNAMGNALQAADLHDETLEHFNQAVTLPGSVTQEAMIARAVLLLESGRKEEATVAFEQALTAFPGSIRASGTGPISLWHLLGRAIRLQGRIVETLSIQEMIVQALPANMVARFDLAETLLLLGNFTRGWQEYRFRYEQEHTQALARRVQRPRWQGQPIRGKTLLIHDEQGFGDTFQFMRMVAWARDRCGARVVFQVNPESLGLARRYLGSEDVIAYNELPPDFDFHCELMSLPLAMNLQLSDLPGSVAYLSADPSRVEKWRVRLADLPRPLVGLVWAGRPTHCNDFRRSIALSDLAPLALPGVTFLALQKGPASAQAATPPEGMSLVSMSDEILDFEDTAALMMLIDLTISVDSAPIHLAGALGRPGWVMLPFVPCWRWLLERDDSPWYPSLRLFRQPGPDQWQPMLESMAQALRQLSAQPQ
jgi:tetratricopeptide (TPR) repeat protein